MSTNKEEPVEVSEEQERARLIGNPNLSLAQERFILTCAAASAEEKAAAKDVLLAAVKEHNMTPFYAFLCETYGWMEDEALVTTMKAANATELATLEATIKDAEEELGETEIREAHLAKADHLSLIGDKEGAISAFRVTTEKTVSLGHKLDIVFHQIRLGMYGSRTLPLFLSRRCFLLLIGIVFRVVVG
jgi:26S proteasome regulatory subunit N7